MPKSPFRISKAVPVKKIQSHGMNAVEALKLLAAVPFDVVPVAVGRLVRSADLTAKLATVVTLQLLKMPIWSVIFPPLLVKLEINLHSSVDLAIKCWVIEW